MGKAAPVFWNYGVKSSFLFSAKMVKLSIKKGDDPQFLYETTVQIPIEDLMKAIVPIYNGRLKVERICGGR